MSNILLARTSVDTSMKMSCEVQKYYTTSTFISPVFGRHLYSLSISASATPENKTFYP